MLAGLGIAIHSGSRLDALIRRAVEKIRTRKGAASSETNLDIPIRELFSIIIRKPLFKSKPAKQLLLATILISGLVAIFLSTPLAGLFGFTSLSMR